jgi:hypothetical protein
MTVLPHTAVADDHKVEVRIYPARGRPYDCLMVPYVAI